ncbi:MAG: hypothetical protein JW803_06305 [Endomicrobiales bacterium]|nr:hypothetical protein [Endomicrobiales bacterium]
MLRKLVVRNGFWFALLIIILALFPGRGPEPYDVLSGGKPEHFGFFWPVTRYLFEPVCGAVEYVLSFKRYIIQLLSWVFWIITGSLIFALKMESSFANGLVISFRMVTMFLSFIMISVFFPFPGPRVTVTGGYTALDPHSHTNYSHDAAKSPENSIYFHKRLAFGSFFVTEHGHTDSFEFFPEDSKLKTVYPGIQVLTTERVSLLVLADKPFDGSEFLHKSVKDVIDLAHSKGFTVICPHWWKWRYFSWEELADLGIDGFEVYNAGYRNFSELERSSLIRFCRAKNLIAAGSTDWHGWGYYTDVWMLVKPPEGEHGIFSALKNTGETKIVVLKRKEMNNFIRYAFEPFFGMYYYFSGLNFWQVIGWLVWIFIFSSLPGYVKSAVGRQLPVVFSAGFLGLGVYSFAIWLPLLPENQMLGKLLAPVFFILALFWFFSFRMRLKDEIWED